jgi:hypothetical protein
MFRAPALVVSLLCAWPAVSTAAEDASYTRVATAFWSAEIPRSWTKKKKLPRAGHTRWVFSSPSGNYVLRVNIAKDPGGDFKKLAESHLARMTKRLTSHEVLSRKHGEARGRPIFHAVLRGQMVRKKYRHDFVTLRVFARLHRKQTLTFSLSARTTHAGDFSEITRRVLGSLRLESPATKPPAPMAEEVRR